MEEISKEKRIEEELQRISVWFSGLEENELAIVSPLLQNAAFMKVTLDDLQEIINKEGCVERYQNGENQYGVKQSAALQSYNNISKIYASVNKTLWSYLPAMKKESKFDAFVRKNSPVEESEEVTRLKEEMHNLRLDLQSAEAGRVIAEGDLMELKRKIKENA